MLDKVRFALYRNIVGTFLGLGFKSHRVEPLATPVDVKIDYELHDDVFPGLPLPGVKLATSYLPSDGAAKRNRKTRVQSKLRALLVRLAPARTDPVPTDEASFMAALYPQGMRRIWPHPTVPPELRETRDSIAALAVRGPFASYLRKAEPDEIAQGEARAGDYVIDMSDYLAYPARDGLARPGGKAVLSVTNGALATTTVIRDDGLERTLAQRAVLAALNEDLTSFRHNLCMHNVVLTDVAIASINKLRARHPIRRVLQHCFHTLLIGNRENATAQLSGPLGFSVTLFSHDATQASRIATARLAAFDFWDFEPDEQFARRGTTETPFAYPYRDNMLELWKATLDYVTDYVGLYYSDDVAVRADAELQVWIDELDRLLPNPIRRPDGGITSDWLARLCATVIHLSTVEHDVANNVVWDYTTLGWIVPCVVPASGEPMDQLRAFDMMAVLVGTWRSFNMLLTSNVASMAIDERGRKVMLAWIDRLSEIQAQMAARGHDPSLAYPANLNVSITN